MKTLLYSLIAALLITIFAVIAGYAEPNPFGIVSTVVVYFAVIYLLVLVIQWIVRSIRRSRDPKKEKNPIR